MENQDQNDKDFLSDILEVKDDLKQATDHLSSVAKHAKEKFDASDPDTKKKITTAVLGAAALIAGAVGLKKIMHKKDKK